MLCEECLFESFATCTLSDIYLISILLLFIFLPPSVNNPVYISPSHVLLSSPLFCVVSIWLSCHIIISMSIMFYIPLTPCINLFVLFVHKKTPPHYFSLSSMIKRFKKEKYMIVIWNLRHSTVWKIWKKFLSLVEN